MITIGLVLWEFYLFKFQTCGFYDFIDIFRFYYIIWIYDFGVDFREVINGDFGLYIYLFYFGKYGCYNLVSERGSVPALTRDGDLWGLGF